MSTISTVSGPSPKCFACGSDNPVGLHLSFTRLPDGGSRAEFVAPGNYVGWPDMIHGGILFTVMDEAVAWALTLERLPGVTGKADVRFRAPVNVGTRLVVTGRIVERKRRTVSTRAELRDADTNAIKAELDATMFLMEG